MTQPNKRPHQAKQTQPAAAPVKPPRAFGAQLAGAPGAYVGRDDLQRMLAGRLPEEWKALQSAACQLQHWHEEACEVGCDSTATAAAELQAEAAARAIFGAGAVCTYQRDPRGLPLFVAWPRMPARFRCPWEPSRGLPIYIPAEDTE